MKSLFVAAVVVVLPSLSQAADSNPFVADSESFMVVVNITAKQSVKASYNLQEGRLRNLAELECRKHSLPVRGGATDTLFVHLSVEPIVIGSEEVGCALSVFSNFACQANSPSGETSKAFAWMSQGVFGVVTSQDMRDTVRNCIQEEAESFAIVWLASHPD